MVESRIFPCRIFCRLSSVVERRTVPKGSLREKSLRQYLIIMPYVYILKSCLDNNWHYVGSCTNINKRFEQHNKGRVISTKSRQPLKLIYFEYYQTVGEARKREYFLKSPKGYLEKKRIISSNSPS